MKRIALVAACLAVAAGPANAAVTTWRLRGALSGFYTDNVFYQESNAGSSTKGSSGGAARGDVGVTSKTPRSDLSIDYALGYRYYSDTSVSNKVEQFLTLAWTSKLSERTNFRIGETASYTPESDNFADRGVDGNLIIGPRAPQTRSTTTLGVAHQLSPNWNLSADYSYRLLSNGPVDVPSSVSGIPVVALTLFDEEGHSANAALACRLSERSDFSIRTYGTVGRYEEDLFHEADRKSTSYGAGLSYGWAASAATQLTIGAGAFHVTSEFLRLPPVPAGQPQPSGPQTLPPAQRSNDYSAELGLKHRFQESALAVGLSRGVSTFYGLATTTASGRIVPAGPSTATTLYVNYSATPTQKSTLLFLANGTRNEPSDTSGYIRALGAGASWDYRFARWGGLTLGYFYSDQKPSSETEFPGRKFSNQSAHLGLFFSTL